MSKLQIIKKMTRPLMAAFIVVSGTIPANAQKIVEDSYFEENETHYPVMLRTNGVYDLAGFPNVGLELQSPYGVALQLDYIGAWWNKDVSHHYYSSYAFQSELRYYFSGWKEGKHFKGHHAGIYGQLVTYDFEFGGTGYQCNRLHRTFGIGLSYGYSFAIAHELSLDLTAGFGWFQTKYDKYKPSNYGTYIGYESRKQTWIGPTKLEASLIWHINTYNE